LGCFKIERRIERGVAENTTGGIEHRENKSPKVMRLREGRKGGRVGATEPQGCIWKAVHLNKNFGKK